MDIEKNLFEKELERAKRRNFNRKCYNCPYRWVFGYEDDTPIGRTPYHWWIGQCELLKVEIASNRKAPENCPKDEQLTLF